MSSEVQRTQYVDMSKLTKRATKLTLDEAAAVVEGQAATLAPTDTGSLRNSIRRDVQSETYAEVIADVDYAVYVEFGTGDQGSGGGKKWTYYSDKLQRFVTTSGMAAQPFMRPAMDFLKAKLGISWGKAFTNAYNHERGA
jgi:HK97 gp10 family phage protein